MYIFIVILIYLIVFSYALAHLELEMNFSFKSNVRSLYFLLYSNYCSDILLFQPSR